MLAFVTAALIASLPPGSAPLDAVPQTRLDADLRCLLGAYALPAGRMVTITGARGQPRRLQYTLSNGQFGTLQPDASGAYVAGSLAIRFAPCAAGTLRLSQGATAERGVRLRLVETQTRFESDGLTLHGKLVRPPNGRAKAMAVRIEGSNNDPSTDDSVWQYELARRGIAVFVYDKRGTGTSAGALLSDFPARARDTAAAVAAARRLAPGIRRVGVIGGSQGGWVAPLTATLVRLDFVIAAFAMAEGPIAQDRELVEQQLAQSGYDETARGEARQLTTITERIVRSNMRDGFAELEAFKAEYAGAAWFKAIQPRSYTGLFLKFSTAELKANGPALAQGLSFDYEPRPVIEAITPRQLWLLAGSDHQAPNIATQAILRQVQLRRPDISVMVFPTADHGLIERTKRADGVVTAYAERVFDLTAQWISDRSRPARARFVVMPPASPR
jgi:dienelactone hydrolase